MGFDIKKKEKGFREACKRTIQDEKDGTNILKQPDPLTDFVCGKCISFRLTGCKLSGKPVKYYDGKCLKWEF